MRAFLVCTISLCCFALNLSANSISTAVSCDTRGLYPSVYTGTTDCYSGPGGSIYQRGTAYANATASLQIPSAASDYLVASTNTFVFVAGDSRAMGFIPYPASAFASESINLELLTAGPPRSGYIQVIIGLSGGGASGTGGLTLDIGGVVEALCVIPAALNGCSSNLDLGKSAGLGGPYLVPFQLGQFFLLNLQSSARSESVSANDELTEAGVGGAVQFRFLEADGVTPVAVLPEPSTAWLFAFALIGTSGLLKIARIRRIGHVN